MACQAERRQMTGCRRSRSVADGCGLGLDAGPPRRKPPAASAMVPNPLPRLVGVRERTAAFARRRCRRLRRRPRTAATVRVRGFRRRRFVEQQRRHEEQRARDPQHRNRQKPLGDTVAVADRPEDGDGCDRHRQRAEHDQERSRNPYGKACASPPHGNSVARFGWGAPAPRARGIERAHHAPGRRWHVMSLAPPRVRYSKHAAQGGFRRAWAAAGTARLSVGDDERAHVGQL